MTKIIGRLKDVGVAKESSRGGGGSPTFWVPKATISFDDKANKARSTMGYGSIAMDGFNSPVTQKWAEGSLEFDMMDENFGVFLSSLLGSVSTSTDSPESGANTHTFSLDNSNQHTSLALTTNEEGIGDLMYKLAMINSMTINITPDDVVKVTVEFMSKQSVDSTETVSYSAENVFVGRHLTFKLANDTSGLSGASHIPLRSLTLNINKNLRRDHNLGTVEPEDILNQGFRVTGDVELDYEGRTYRDLMSDGSYRAVRIDLTNTQQTITGTSTNPSFKLDLSRVDFEAWEPAFPNDEIASQSFTFTGLYDTSNGNVINDCELINGHDGTNY